MSYYQKKWVENKWHHSWGESIGISNALLMIADELHELNKKLEKKSKSKDKTK